MILPRLFNHGILRSIKKENNKLVLEGTTGKVEFEDSGLPSIGESDAGKVLMVDGGEAKWLWQLPPGSAGQFLKRTGTGQNFAFSDIKEVPTEGTDGQVLTKTSNGYGWADASGGGSYDPVALTIGYDDTTEHLEDNLDSLYSNLELLSGNANPIIDIRGFGDICQPMSGDEVAACYEHDIDSQIVIGTLVVQGIDGLTDTEYLPINVAFTITRSSSSTTRVTYSIQGQYTQDVFISTGGTNFIKFDIQAEVEHEVYDDDTESTVSTAGTAKFIAITSQS